jgi:hypothetical protein
LNWLNETLDAHRQAEIDDRHRCALAWQPVDRPPLVISHPLPPDARFQPWPHHEIFDDPAKMLFNELVHAFETSIATSGKVGDDLPWTIRANFGTVVIASLFGARVEQVDDNPPWVQPNDTRPLTLRSLRDVDPTDYSQGWCPRVLERCEFFHEAVRQHPALAGLLRIVLPDLQGPFDTLEMLVGSEAFVALHDAPADVAATLHALAAAQVGLARHLAPLTTDA